MKRLPKVEKNIGGCLTKVEKVRKAVLGIALVAGLGFVSGVPNSVDASVGQLGNTAMNTGTVITFTPAVANGEDMVAYHQSHRSHYSHQSHRSHYSHYSSYN